MAIHTLTVQTFRNFKAATFAFAPRITLIEGVNGSGKTSLLEALHYGCYLRSFRTHTPSDLLFDGQEAESAGFSLKIATDNDLIHIGCQGKRRVVRVNNQAIDHYHDLVDNYVVVSFIEDDLGFIKGYPEARRSFIDQALGVTDRDYHQKLRAARRLVEQRNALIKQIHAPNDQYLLWTNQLARISDDISSKRRQYLEELSFALGELVAIYSKAGEEESAPSVSLSYLQKPYGSIEELFQRERASGRTQFGPHLDDIVCTFAERSARAFSSRGQQKLTIMLIKIAQLKLKLGGRQGHGTVTFLLDDFLTDFDTDKVERLVRLLLSFSGIQLIITVPQRHEFLYDLCAREPGFGVVTL